jgi:hypothetical protein
MDFEITHQVDAAPRAVAEVLLSEDYQRSLRDIGALHDRELISQQEEDGGRVRRRVRSVLDIELNPTVRRLVGQGDPAWIEESVWHPTELRWEWDIHPEIGGELLSARGTIDIEASGDGAARHVRGHVKVKVPLYGGKVEGWIVDGLERAYTEEAERLAAWIEREKA